MFYIFKISVSKIYKSLGLEFFFKERRQTEELLPAGNIAHAQVWSHYFGLLQYLLPGLNVFNFDS